MGWSLPDIPARSEAQPWSPWVCLFILLAGVFIALVQVVLHAPAGGLSSLASGHWLPLTVKTLTGITVAMTGYLLWWEIQAYSPWRWNSWRRNTQRAWQQQAYQHRCVVSHVLLTADAQLVPRLAGVVSEDREDTPRFTLPTEDMLVPGILRFEQLSRLLIKQIKPALLQRYPAGPLTILLQTSAPDKAPESACFSRLWSDGSIPWTTDIQVLPKDVLPADDWNQRLSTTQTPLLVLAMHYRQPEETLPEFACALLLMPPALLKDAEQRDAVRVFRAMPLNTDALVRELTELRDMAQQPVKTKHLVWHSGLLPASQQALGRVVNDLPLPLHSDIAAGGVIDVDKAIAVYGASAGWLMMAVATEMVRYGPANHWLLQADNKHATALVVGNSQPVVHDENRDLSFSPPPYPAGSLMLAVLLNALVFWFAGKHSPEWLFSWSGVVTVLLSLVVTLPGSVLGLRHVVTALQRPRFIQAAGRARKE